MSEINQFQRKEGTKSVFSALSLNASYLSHGKSSSKYNLKPFLQQERLIKDRGNSWYSAHKFGESSYNISAAWKSSSQSHEESAALHCIAPASLPHVLPTDCNPVILECSAALAAKKESIHTFFTKSKSLSGLEKLKEVRQYQMGVHKAESGKVEPQEFLEEIEEEEKETKSVIARKPDTETSGSVQSSTDTEIFFESSSPLLPPAATADMDLRSKETCESSREPNPEADEVTPSEEAPMIAPASAPTDTASELCSPSLSCTSISTQDSADRVTQVVFPVSQPREASADSGEIVQESPRAEAILEEADAASLCGESAEVTSGETSAPTEKVNWTFRWPNGAPPPEAKLDYNEFQWLMGKLKSIFLFCS